MSEELEQDIARAHADLEDFITFRAGRLRRILKEAPKTYSIRGGDDSFAEGWVIGFRRCLAILESAAKKEEL